MATANIPTVSPPAKKTTRLRVVSDEYVSEEFLDEELAERQSGWHRIKEVREQQGVSLRTASRRLGIDTRTVRAEEDAETDLTLSRLFHWQEILDVPLQDLLAEPDGSLSRPVQERAKMVRVMKTAMSIRESTEDGPVNRLATMLVEQLIDVMPELDEISAWHTVGQRRSMDELGRIAERPISCNALSNSAIDD